MARLTGPLMSLDASGSVAGALTFAKWKGRNYVRQLVTPANPKSAAQTAFRAMFGYLSRLWASIDTFDAGSQASWEDLAEAGNYSPFNAYMRYNQDRWSRFLAPVIDPAATPASAGALSTPAATAGVKSIAFTVDCAVNADTWGIIVFRAVGAAPTGLQTEVIAITEYQSGGTAGIQDLGLTPGVEYHYRAIAFSKSGQETALTADVDATPT